MKRMVLKSVGIILSLLLAMIIIIVIAFSISPKPGALLIRHMFDSQTKIIDKSKFAQAKANVNVIDNQHYKSQFKDSEYDLYTPKNQSQILPVLIWVHGGAYVGGDKASVKEFATKLASDANIVVVSMNYQRAPELQYPNQLIQVSELVNQLRQKNLGTLNMQHVLLGGDSAGAQIALQYALTQTNQAYRRELGMNQSLKATAIKATISYCGPVALNQMVEQKPDTLLGRFFIKTVAWSEFNLNQWTANKKLRQASLIDHVTKDFPPTYVTDGNANSFQEQGLAFTKRLKALGVPVDSLFFNQTNKQLSHEYQFDYATQEAQTCYEQTVNFVKSHR